MKDNILTLLENHFSKSSQADEMWDFREDVPAAMKDGASEAGDPFVKWKPIPSQVTEENIQQLEKLMKHPLPVSYKTLLQYQHFVEMTVGEEEVSFFRNLPNNWLNELRETIVDYDEFGGLLDRHLLPIADFGEDGVVCFDANAPAPDFEYPLVRLDFGDEFKKVHPLATGLFSFLKDRA